MSNPLESFLRSHHSEGALTRRQLEGFLYALLSAPELMETSEWVPLVFGKEPAFKDRGESVAVLEELMTLYSDINDSIVAGSVALPRDCQFRDDPLANLETDAPVSQWAQGFLHAHEWLTGVWEAVVPEELGEEHAMQIMVLSFFSSRTLAEEFRLEAETSSLAEMAAAMQKVFPLALAEYARVGRLLQPSR